MGEWDDPFDYDPDLDPPYECCPECDRTKHKLEPCDHCRMEFCHE